MLEFSFPISLRSLCETDFQDRNLDENQLLEVIFAKNEKNRDTAFWSELSECNGDFHDIVLHLYIAAAVPLRPIVAVYHHVRRSHHPLKLQGQWKEHEDDLLTQYIRPLASCILTHQGKSGPSQILANNGRKLAFVLEGWHLTVVIDIEIILSTATFACQVRFHGLFVLCCIIL